MASLRFHQHATTRWSQEWPPPDSEEEEHGMDAMDSWTQEVNGIRYRVRIVPDDDASPGDYEDYTPRQVKAWEEGEWKFAGVLVSPDIPGLDDGWLGASLWGTDYGNMPLTTEDDELTGQTYDPAAYVRDDVVPELVDELWAQPDATARLTELRDAISAILASLQPPAAAGPSPEPETAPPHACPDQPGDGLPASARCFPPAAGRTRGEG
jgi:hypothetical protein